MGSLFFKAARSETDGSNHKARRLSLAELQTLLPFIKKMVETFSNREIEEQDVISAIKALDFLSNLQLMEKEEDKASIVMVCAGTSEVVTASEVALLDICFVVNQIVFDEMNTNGSFSELSFARNTPLRLVFEEDAIGVYVSQFDALMECLSQQYPTLGRYLN